MNVLILDFLKLPRDLQATINIPGNDCYVNCYLEAESIEQMREWYDEDDFDTTINFEDWIKDQGYELAGWVYDNYSKEELEEAELILWEISW